MIRRISQNQVEKVVVLYKDRLLRFGFELIEYIASLYNCEIEIIDNTEKSLLFTQHYPARCFGMNMPKFRDIQAKIPLPQAIWNEFWLRY